MRWNFCKYTQLCVGAKGQYINRIFYWEPCISCICPCFQTLKTHYMMDFIRIPPSTALALLKLNWIQKSLEHPHLLPPLFSPKKTLLAPNYAYCTTNSFTLAALSKLYQHINFLYLYFIIFLHLSNIRSSGL